mmetsp:Transcript_61017/g.108488  ORF Transcript_61017/g.108488 Transcript_61017/m.108488 type:complete len:594 (+) Transcript_61017:138-1919(+)|eukprot:CAMPEP_0197663232 /NCGR_PEP_ID=MMETSP1338-20131121/56629_1 /TAXON_ID=43686 ORGANISM="Pelagodinium beii, Strain RCC1491" /NCGR_SAMPLE_ID=MMETSP1338 /ASSEMBLY_ACC=CAM_ASM_000754 /LENGTH=593 /DNA_ID=CAMNT_0043241499 /DNA_START=138 /DNA_END=1919 /DNA_ORIENTATION=+
MAYIKLNGKWVLRASLATAVDPNSNSANDPSEVAKISPLQAAPEAAEESSHNALGTSAQWIIDGLVAVGSFASAGCTGPNRDFKRRRMLDAGITHVINCAQELDCAFRDDFTYLHLPARDVTGYKMIAHWSSTFEFIEEVRQSGGRVLVHCAGGHSRSGSTAVAYLMQRFELSLEEALERARERRRSIEPNPGFLEQLEEYRRGGFKVSEEATSRGQAIKGGFSLASFCKESLQTRVAQPRPGLEGYGGTQAAEIPQAICIQFCSDMHLELPGARQSLGHHLLESMPSAEAPGDHALVESNVLLPEGPRCTYLALLGDIFDGAKVRDGTYRDFLLKQCDNFETVFILAGNHEFYRSEYEAGRLALAAMCVEVNQRLGRLAVHFLDCNSFDLPNSSLRILGCTLWSYVGDEQAESVASSLNDYTAIRSDGCEIGVADTNAWHAQQLRWLQREITRAKEDGKRCVVMTHHAPSFHGTCAPRHLNSPISAGFCNSLERLLCPPVTAWLFGHTHWSSWQRYRSSEGGEWSTLSGGADKGPCKDELAAAGSCHAAKGEVLVASNQLGYGAMGEHRHTRCHPQMFLEVAPDGSCAHLRC